MPSKSTAKSNLTVSAALYEDVRCKLGDAEQTISDLNEKVAGLKDELDTAKYFRDALDFEPEQEQQTKTNSNETCRPELRCPTGHELVAHGSFPSRPWYCDFCSTQIEAPGFSLYSCMKCDYNICPVCFVTPGATDRPPVDASTFPKPTDDHWTFVKAIMKDQSLWCRCDESRSQAPVGRSVASREL
jgi:hypothetical protein